MSRAKLDPKSLRKLRLHPLFKAARKQGFFVLVEKDTLEFMSMSSGQTVLIYYPESQRAYTPTPADEDHARPRGSWRSLVGRRFHPAADPWEALEIAARLA